MFPHCFRPQNTVPRRSILVRSLRLPVSTFFSVCRYETTGVTSSSTENSTAPAVPYVLDYRTIAASLPGIERNAKERNVSLMIAGSAGATFSQAFTSAYEQVRTLRHTITTLNAKKNTIDKERKQSAGPPSRESIEQARHLKEERKTLEQHLREAEVRLFELCRHIPNDTHPDVALRCSSGSLATLSVDDAPACTPRVVRYLNASIGASLAANRMSEGDAAKQPKDHSVLMEERGWVNFHAGRSASGHRGYMLEGDAVRLHHALMGHALDVAEHGFGFRPVLCPSMVRRPVADACGFLARDHALRERDMYAIQGDDGLCLSATAEIALAALHARSQLSPSALPLRYVGWSSCFRPEAGNSGRNAKGLYRVHEFAKLELFVVCLPKQSDAELERLLDVQRAILEPLEIPCRVLDMPPAELGASAYRKYDIEAWWPSRFGAAHTASDGSSTKSKEITAPEWNDMWGELTSASNCTTYQARRLGIRYVDETGPQFCHTLNATAMALPRTLAALIENHQCEWPRIGDMVHSGEGNVATPSKTGVRIPTALRKYLGGREWL